MTNRWNKCRKIHIMCRDRWKKDKMTACCLFVPILIVLQDFGSVVGGRWSEQGVLAWPKPQGSSLPWAGVTAQLGGELVGHGGAWRQDGSAVEQSWWEIPAQKEEEIEYCFYGYHCRFIIGSAATKTMKLNTLFPQPNLIVFFFNNVKISLIIYK